MILAGIDLGRARVSAFMVSAAAAGAVGAILAFTVKLAAPSAFTLTLSLTLLAAIVLGGVGNGARADELRVTGPTSLAGEGIEVFRVNAGGTRVLVTTRTLNDTGDQPRIRVADRNGSKRTTYVVELVGSQRVNAADSKPVTLR